MKLVAPSITWGYPRAIIPLQSVSKYEGVMSRAFLTSQYISESQIEIHCSKHILGGCVLLAHECGSVFFRNTSKHMSAINGTDTVLNIFEILIRLSYQI